MPGDGEHPQRDQGGSFQEITGEDTPMNNRPGFPGHAEQTTRILYAIADAVNKSEDLQELYGVIHHILGSVIDVTNFFIAIVDSQKRTLYFPYHVDTVDTDFSPIQGGFDTDSSLTGLVVKKRRPILLLSHALQERAASNGVWGPCPLIWMGSPLLVREEVIGVVAVQSYTEADIYEERDLQLLAAVSQQIAFAIDRKRYLDRLQESERKLDLLVRNSSDSLCIISADGIQTYCSPAAERITGFTSADLEGKPITDIIHPDDHLAIRNAWHEAVTHPDKPIKVQYRHIHKSRGWVYFEAHAQSFLHDPAINGVIASVRDITEQMLANQLLRESEDKFRLTFDFSPDAVAITRLGNGVYVEINQGFTRTFGYAREEAIGRTAIDLNIWHNPGLRQDLIDGPLSDGLCENIETQFRRKDGSIITGLVSARTIDLKGVPHIVSYTRDITERKRHEKEQLKLDKLESLGILAGGIAHDFNNILTGIMGNISFSKVFIDAGHNAFKPLTDAEKATKRAGELAHQLLTFSRGGEPNKKTVSPSHLVHESVSLALHGSNVKSTIDIPEDIHAFEVDEGQMSQVFHNIIINATQAMPGGGMLTVSARNDHLSARNDMSLNPGPYIRLTFADQGCGIPVEDLKKIFDPYFTTKSTGNGLGLASSYSIISRHRGHIGASSTVGKGTVFTIHLPSLGRPYSTELAGTPGHESGDNPGGSVLVMDDEEIIRHLATGILCHLGYKVTTCASGEQAVELYAAAEESGTPFDAVIMDLTIPGGMGGRQTAERILSRFPRACLIASSGYSNDPIISNCRDYGFRDAIAKPYNIGEIERVLCSLLSQRTG